ncbi:nuclear transport factor 2 family protein [Tsukamurella sp. 8F]|uniref:nuclear transport factor 2 family protein n=1 Tax=unclassified Tsukamurella TaxID=2633480 RepID=UPI0023B89530|nr:MULTISPECIES: nuclear transport factor 2 family protein [unclassified Tsukamurella]MDF0528592.1 nuclear transport factor 2 family protein [Tsukamurella sp. 8J]MDF0585554.1 nuclear transport factor 2 family protein [Tsukamurella sp. 8F]
MPTTDELAARFHSASSSGDSETLRSLLADDVRFIGPVAHTSGVEDTVAGLVEMAEAIRVDEVAVLVGGDADAIIWSDVSLSERPAIPVATWLHFDADGRIGVIRTVFDQGR